MKRNLEQYGIILIVVIAVIILLSITRWGWIWTGLVAYTIPQTIDNRVFIPGKTLWDILELFIIPGALAVIALLFSNRERKDDREIALDRQREEALQSYYDKMADLMLENKMREAQEGEEVITIARSRTLVTLRSLDGARKGSLIEFLYESRLIEKEHPVINLETANLNKVFMGRTNLTKISLHHASLMNANLEFSDLREADLGHSVLMQASLRQASLEGTDLSGASLSGANLWRANLSGANLSGANFSPIRMLLIGQPGENKPSDAQVEKELNVKTVPLKKSYIRQVYKQEGHRIQAHQGADNIFAYYLDQANLDEADLSGADLEGAYLYGVDLSKVKNVTDEQLAKAASLTETTMPDGKIYNPSIHTEIARLRNQAGRDAGDPPPVKQAGKFPWLRR